MLQDDQFMCYDGVEEYLYQEHTRNLFGQPDVLLLDEYLHVYQSSFAQTPEMKLVAAVLKDGIDCYLKYYSATKPKRGRKRRPNEAEEWFFSKDERWLFSFENVCGLLKLEPDYIRRALLNHKQNHAKALESGSANPEPCALRLAS